MVVVFKEKGNPGQNDRGTYGTSIALRGGSSLSDSVPVWEAEAQRLRLLKGGRAVFIVAATYRPSGARRNSVFMTSTGAQRHATKLIERGHMVRIELATLTPTTVLLGGESS